MLLSNHSANTDDATTTNDVVADQVSSSASSAVAAPRHRHSRTPSSDTDRSVAGVLPRRRSTVSVAANDTTAAAAGSKSPGKRLTAGVDPRTLNTKTPITSAKTYKKAVLSQR